MRAGVLGEAFIDHGANEVAERALGRAEQHQFRGVIQRGFSGLMNIFTRTLFSPYFKYSFV